MRQTEPAAASPHESNITRLNWATIGVIVALMVQAGGFVFWTGQASHRLAALEEVTTPLRDGTFARLDQRTQDMSKTMDNRFTHQADQLEHIRTLLESRR